MTPSERRKAATRARAKRLYDERRAAGACARLGCEERAAAGHVYCDACREAVNALTRAAKRERRRREG